MKQLGEGIGCSLMIIALVFAAAMCSGKGVSGSCAGKSFSIGTGVDLPGDVTGTGGQP